MVSTSSTSGIHPVQLPTSQVPTSATDSCAQPIPGAFSAGRAEPAVPPRPHAPPPKPRASLLQMPFLAEALNIHSGGSSLERLDLPLSQVVPSDALLMLENHTGSRAPFSGEQGEKIEARHEPEYNLIRIYVGHLEHVVNINLSDDGKTVRSITGYPPVSPAKLHSLVTAGLLDPDLLRIVGALQEPVKIATGAAAHDQQLNLRLQTHSVERLPSIENYFGTNYNTKLVGQGEAHCLSSAKPDVRGLYTAGACDCLILIAVVKDAVGKPEHIAMAHVDEYVEDQAVKQFFSSLPASGKVEVTLLAGNEKVAKRAMRAADKAEAAVVFAHAGHKPDGAYCAAVDRDGGIYFGNRFSLSRQINSAKAIMRIMDASINGGSLPLSEQLPVKFHI